MADLNRYVTLNNGNKMPILGLGTYMYEDKEKCIENIVHAVVECGYRHLDCAALYGNEDHIGEALEKVYEHGIKREDLFITSKCWRYDLKDPEAALKKTLTDLKLEYIDLYLIHWTVTEVDWENGEVVGPPMHEVWKNFEALYDAGLAKNIGVSNCNVMMFLDILAGAKVKPQVNQIECHPYNQQAKLIKLFQKFGCEITCYAPIGAGDFYLSDKKKTKLLDHEVVNEIAEKHSITPAQVCLAWNLHRGVIVIPKTSSNERLKQNFEALNVKLDDEDFEKIVEIDENYRFFDPGNWDAPEIGWSNNPIFL